MTEPKFPFLRVQVDQGRADEISALLFELGAGGVEERDESTFVRGPGGGRAELVASFESREAAEEAARELRALGEGLEPSIDELVGDAWRDAWKAHYRPFSLTPELTVAPPWIPYEKQRPEEQVLVLEPGRAFGTGLHATTSLVAEVLGARREALEGREVLDAGTGSGILALAALLLGAERVDAFDVDEVAVAAARENAERNGLSERLRVWTGGAETIEKSYPLVLANIEARILGPIAEPLASAVEKGGVLVLSGVLAHEREAMLERYGALGLRHVETRRRSDAETGAIYQKPDDWVALVFERPA